MARTRLRDVLGIDYPLISAPMGGVAGGELATAVSVAGGLGMIGMGSTGTPEALHRQLKLMPGDVQFGIGMVDWVVEQYPQLLEIALTASPVLLSVSFGASYSWVAHAHEAGIAAAVQVADSAEAEAAHNAGVDILVARGLQGGGHGKPLHERDTVLEAVLSVTDRPVVAAGAIATRDDVRACLAAGASGVWIGTAFMAAYEALSSPATKQRLFLATGADTVVTTAFDSAAGYRWPPDIPERVVANAFTDRWDSDASDFDAGRASEEFRAATRNDDPAGMSINAGTGVDAVDRESSAADIVHSLMR